MPGAVRGIGQRQREMRGGYHDAPGIAVVRQGGAEAGDGFGIQAEGWLVEQPDWSSGEGEAGQGEAAFLGRR